MTSYSWKGIEKASLSQDRTDASIQIRTDKGLIDLKLESKHLESLITTLEGLEYHASLLRPAKGALPGESAQVRAQIVAHYQIGIGDVNGTQSVFIGLKSAQVFRWYALDAAKAKALHQALENEIPKLQTGKRAN